MNILSDIQLRKMSVAELDSLVDSLYSKHDSLKSAIDVNVWVGDYGGVSSTLGVEATREIEEVKSYINLVEKIIEEKEKDPKPIKTSIVPSREPNEHVSEELYFSTYAEAKEWSKSNDGRAFSRSADGLGYASVNKKRKTK